MQWIVDLFEWAQQGLFELAVQPIMYSFGMGGYLEDGYTATGWLLVGLIQIAMLLAIIGPLQRWRPVEPMVDAASIRTDIIYPQAAVSQRNPRSMLPQARPTSRNTPSHCCDQKPRP